MTHEVSVVEPREGLRESEEGERVLWKGRLKCVGCVFC